MATVATAADPTTQPHPTILRIRRRKRNEHETLDALIIEDGRSSSRPMKRTRGHAGELAQASTPGEFTFNAGKGIFRFAETVPTSVFASDDSKRTLKARIASLIKHPPPRQSSGYRSGAPNILSSQAAMERKSPRSSVTLTNSMKRSSSKHDVSPTPTSVRSSNSNLVLLQEKAQRHARYRIIQEKRNFRPAKNDWTSHTSIPAAPPIVRSSQSTLSIELEPQSSPALKPSEDFKILDARLESDYEHEEDNNDPIAKSLRNYTQKKRFERSLRSPLHHHRQVEGHKSGSRLQDGVPPVPDDDDAMANFVPMLQEYLSLNRSGTPENLRPPDGCNDVSPPHPGFESAPDLSSGDAADSDSEWVYDVYYRDVGPDGLNPGPGGIDIASNCGLQKIAALTGLEEDEILLGEGEGEEDSDTNTDDEDSNDEDFYRNDYPEGDDDASDVDDLSGTDEDTDQYDSDY